MWKACGSAAGVYLSPLIVYKGQNLYGSWCENGPEHNFQKLASNYICCYCCCCSVAFSIKFTLYKQAKRIPYNFRTERLNKNGGLMFYNQYTFNSFPKSEALNLSDFMMKLI